MLGVRDDDPNDRIPHQHRRSLRASWVLFAWLSVLDPSSINTIDSYVEEGGRHFVRHYFFDFGCAFGSATNYAQGVQQDGEYLVEVGRTLAALFSLGLLPAAVSGPARRMAAARSREHPALGYFPAESFDPDTFRTNRKLPSHMRLTDRDAYWGAKLVTAFSDEQIAALVATARLPDADARYLDRGLRVRRDIIGRRYLRAVAAVENPSMAPDGTRVCFEDLAIARGYAQPAEVRYVWRSATGSATASRASSRRPPDPPPASRSAAPIAGSGYRVVEIRARFVGAAGREGVHVEQGDARASALARRRRTASSSPAWRGTNDRRGRSRVLDRGCVAAAAARRRSVRASRRANVLPIRAAARRWTAACPPSLRPAGRWRARRWSCRAWRRRPCSGRSSRPPTSSNTTTSSTGGARCSRPTTAWSASVPSCSIRPASCRPAGRASSTGACPVRAARS